jgi:tRNA(fMet)-specific endonuclease VapC
MTLFVLDSDTLSLFQAGHPRIAERVDQCKPGEVATTVISVDEQLRGWFSLVRKAKHPKQLAFAYERLSRSVSLLSKMRILTYTENAIASYDGLKKSKVSPGGNDLRIAVIALEFGGVVVTRNVTDFQVVPGLLVEDWSVE